MNLGSTSINLVSDGTMLKDGGSVFGQIPKTEWSQHITPDRNNRVRLGINCMLIQTPDANILVNAGTGSKQSDKLKDTFGLTGNKLLKGLRSFGITARDVDIVILSDLFIEHGGGCTKMDRSGIAVPTFPKARHIVQKSSWEDAQNPNDRFNNRFNPEDFLPLQEKNLIEIIDGDTEIIPGVNIKVTNGPSIGHQIVLVERGSEKVAFLSNLIPTPMHLMPNYIAAWDMDPNNTLLEKQETLTNAVKDGWLVVFGHAKEHPAGYIRERNGRAEFLPVAV